jgi:hypothetical protein
MNSLDAEREFTAVASILTICFLAVENDEGGSHAEEIANCIMSARDRVDALKEAVRDALIKNKKPAVKEGI